MGRLKFKDIDEWTPSSISIVDKPDHQLAYFEVYENDEEYVKKSIEIKKGEIMSEQNPQKENIEQEGMVTAPVGFFEKLFGGLVTKSTEPLNDVLSQNSESDTEKILAAIADVKKDVKSIDERVSKLEGEETKEDEPDEEPAPGAVNKNKEDSAKEDDKNKKEDKKPTKDTVVDTSSVVAKSQALDPDNSKVTTSDKSLMERVGRNHNGMTW